MLGKLLIVGTSVIITSAKFLKPTMKALFSLLENPVSIVALIVRIALWDIFLHIYIYIYAHPHDRPSCGRGRVVSVPRHDLSTERRQSPLPNSIPKCPFIWLAILEISTHACNAPSPNLNLSSALSATITVCSSPNSSISVNISISLVVVLILG